MKHQISLPLLVNIQDGAGVRHVKIEDRGAALALRAMADAKGAWIEPKDISTHGASLSRHVSKLRRQYGIKIETETVQDGVRFFNRHRLVVGLSIVTDKVAP